jgi:hypothetical protein
LTAVLVKTVLNWSKEPNELLIASASGPLGSPPPLGERIVQNSEWFAWPPPWLRTGVDSSAGISAKSFINSWIGLAESSGLSASAALSLSM